MLKTFVLAAASVAVAGALTVTAPAPAEAGLFCQKSGYGFVAKKARFQKWCDARTQRVSARASKRVARK